ncbi:TPR repeat-containing protein DDB_G0287407 isoform X2 [Lingula anatina]|uniref:TPR repeat-containing protein DDB_G0287407 isoform X2 n=1 Tax=Lingula anatina TaxID=7574 RepID=A0A1S3HIY4_LINAN|nr:TPR repeat-containing protein DDB_G0287407 isoform X2 [Lingula anatina]|eukprot:XP_013385421.1 TPR repeat-containing protein DDB_G0287407 isoform X2 [Lingula anatina]
MGANSFFSDSDDSGPPTPRLHRSLSHVKQQFHLRKPVCPFISSTFQDFQREREYLTKKVFPTIDSVCRERGTSFTPVDLRWGINDAQANSGHVLQLCLEYINKSAPFFIGLLGERYGGHRPPNALPVPDNYEDLSKDAFWLDKNLLVAAAGGHKWVLQEAHQQSSITELEIMQSVFLNDSKHCYFYFRQPEHVDYLYVDLPEEKRKNKLKVFYPESEYETLKVRELKQRIVKKGLPVKYYRTPQELGQLILQDWLKVIDQLYPPLEDTLNERGALQFREWMAHEAFAESRRHVFVSTQDLEGVKTDLTDFAEKAAEDQQVDFMENFQLEKKNNHRYHVYQQQSFSALRKRKPQAISYQSLLLLVGERGCGKTSVLSNWVKGFSKDHPDIKVIAHYVGSNSSSTDIASFMRRCTLELREEYHCSGSETVQSTNTEDLGNFHRICEAFIAATAMGPCVLVLDGIDEMGGTSGLTPQMVKEMAWLPMPLPPQCKIIITTAKSDLTYRSLVHRGDTQIVKVPLISDNVSKSKIIQEHLAVHCKSLNSEQIERIVSCKLSDRPLFLSVLCNELRVFGVYTALDQHLDWYLSAYSIRDAWTRIIHRWIRDYGWTTEQAKADFRHSSFVGQKTELTGWVADALRLLCCSRQGLSQSEILEVLKQLGYHGKSTVTSFDWALLQSVATESFIQHPGGLINFFHQHLKEAVEYALLGCVTPAAVESTLSLTQNKETSKQHFHQVLATYFYEKKNSLRRTDELTWQLERCGDMEKLCEVLSQPSVFLDMFGDDKQYHCRKLDLLHYWKLLKDAGYDPRVVYPMMLVNSDACPGLSLKCTEPYVESSSYPARSSDQIDPMSGQFSVSSAQNAVIPVILTSRASEASLHRVTSSGSLYKTQPPSQQQQSQQEDAPSISSSMSSTSLSSMVSDAGSQSDASETSRPSTPVMLQRDKAFLAKSVGVFLSELGCFEEAEQILLYAHEELYRNYPLSEEDQRLLCVIQESVADLYLYQLKKDMAETWYKKALKTQNEYKDEGLEVDDFAQALETKGRLLDCLGTMKIYDSKFSEAEEQLLEAQQCMESAFSVPGKATVQYHLGVLRMRQLDFVKAESCYRLALSIREQWFGKNHPVVAEVLNDLGGLLSCKENTRGYDKAQAEDLYRRALKIREQCLGSEHLLVATTLFHLGKLLKSEGSLACKTEARGLMMRALDIRTQKLGAQHHVTKAVRKSLMDLETSLKLGKYDFGPAKPTDRRSRDRPGSSLSFRDKDLMKISQRSKSESGSSWRPKSGYLSTRTSQVDSNWPSRPQSRFTNNDLGGSCGDLISEDGYHSDGQNEQQSNGPLHKNLMKSRSLSMTYDRFDRDNYDADLVSRLEHMALEPTAEEEEPTTPVGLPTHIESFAPEVESQYGITESQHSASPTTHSGALKKKANKTRSVPIRPASLFEKYSARSHAASHQAPGSHTSHTGSRSGILSRLGSAISGVTGRSFQSSMTSHEVHRSRCYIPTEHSIDIDNAFTIQGPHSSVKSLLGPPPAPRDISKGVHHGAAWYHVPGRYPTNEKPYPPKRSQTRYKVLTSDQYMTVQGGWYERDQIRGHRPLSRQDAYDDVSEREGHVTFRDVFE